MSPFPPLGSFTRYTRCGVTRGGAGRCSAYQITRHVRVGGSLVGTRVSWLKAVCARCPRRRSGDNRAKSSISVRRYRQHMLGCVCCGIWEGDEGSELGRPVRRNTIVAVRSLRRFVARDSRRRWLILWHVRSRSRCRFVATRLHFSPSPRLACYLRSCLTTPIRK